MFRKRQPAGRAKQRDYPGIGEDVVKPIDIGEIILEEPVVSEPFKKRQKIQVRGVPEVPKIKERIVRVVYCTLAPIFNIE